MVSKELLQGGFLTVSITIAKKIGLNESIYLYELVTYDGIVEKNNSYTKINDKNYFYHTSSNIEEKTTLSQDQQTSIIKKLIKLNLIQVVKCGLPMKNYFLINYEKLEEILESNNQKKQTPVSENFGYLKPKKSEQYNSKLYNSKILLETKVSNNNTEIVISPSAKGKGDKLISSINNEIVNAINELQETADINTYNNINIYSTEEIINSINANSEIDLIKLSKKINLSTEETKNWYIKYYIYKLSNNAITDKKKKSIISFTLSFIYNYQPMFTEFTNFINNH